MKVSVTLLSWYSREGICCRAAGTNRPRRNERRRGKREKWQGHVVRINKTSRQWTSVGAPPRRKSLRKSLRQLDEWTKLGKPTAGRVQEACL